ncbi:uncharacterized protein [Palaemon carinicauda]|uniref:uncharacterized protein n=1 Tax=Palaemon carinicauda TaxID=392227 RepID=UPI0035B65065
MTFFRMPRFLRRFVRRRTKYIPEEDALSTKRNLSLAYAFIAWNVFGYIAYLGMTGRLKRTRPEDESISKGRYFARLLNAKNVTLIRVEGLTPVSRVLLDDEGNAVVPASNAEEESENRTEEVTEEDTSGEAEL